MNKLKDLWNKLAKENSMYYINSDYGRRITEEEFIQSGKDDYRRFILDDDLVKTGSLDVDILEIGCGIGRMTAPMRLDFRKVIGIDISGEMIRQGKKRLEKYPNIELLETDGEHIPLPDNCIDIAFSYLVFQHIKDKSMVEKNFEEVYRVLKPKGLFKVRIRSDEVDLNKWWGGVAYTEQSIGKLIKRIGYKLLKTEPVGNYGFWLWLEK